MGPVPVIIYGQYKFKFDKALREGEGGRGGGGGGVGGGTCDDIHKIIIIGLDYDIGQQGRFQMFTV